MAAFIAAWTAGAVAGALGGAVEPRDRRRFERKLYDIFVTKTQRLFSDEFLNGFEHYE